MKARAIVSILFNLVVIGFIMSLSVYSYSASYSTVQAQQVQVAQAATPSISLASIVEHNGQYLANQNYLQNEFV
jgi:hypothetical protein